MPSEEHLSKVGGIGAIAGVVVLLAATMLHPLGAHPGDAPAAFAEYAMDRHWVATHLAQLLAIVLVAAGLVALSWKLRAGRAGIQGKGGFETRPYKPAFAGMTTEGLPVM